MVPVINEKNEVLFPTRERRARRLMERNEAKPYFQHGIFCIKLVRVESEKREEYPKIAVGIDPGSKREGYTIITPTGVIMNITSNTPDWVKDHIETRRMLRRGRRYRKTPYRACRENRVVLLTKRVPPSTKARWDSKLRILKLLVSILPITHINVEDIKAMTLKGKKQWNIAFSPLEVGKEYFYAQIILLFPNIVLIKTSGIKTSQHRKARGFAKTSKKLEYTWAAHNSDSHSLAELALQENVEPYFGLYKIEFLQSYRRQLHRQNFQKDGKRPAYGTTISAGIPRGSIMRDLTNQKLYYLGGYSKPGFVAIQCIATKQRIKQFKKILELKLLYYSNYTVQLMSNNKEERHSSSTIQSDGGGLLPKKR